jgi:hypothetical protein
MHIIETNTLSADQKQDILRLWNNEYSQKLNKDMAGFDSYLNNLEQQQHILLVNEQEQVLGWAFLFTRDAERWFAIILDAAIQKQGYGKLLIDNLKAKEPILNGWVADHDRDIKTDGTYYISPLPFYLKNDFKVIPECRLENEILSAVKIVWDK